MAFPVFSREKIHLPAAIIAGIACVLLARSGILFLFFLIPLGVACFRFNGETSWAALGAASALNLILALPGIAVQNALSAIAVSNVVFFTAMTLAFTWINSPKLVKMPGVWRFIAGSVFMAAVFLGIFNQRLDDEIVYEVLREQIGEINSIYRSVSQDAAQIALLDSVTPELMIEMIRAMMFRGGALVSAVFIFWMSREAGMTITRWTIRFGKRSREKDAFAGRQRFLKNFYAASSLIWVLIATLVLLFIFNFLTAPPLEVLLWNIFVLCAILYLAQGFGILQFFASKLTDTPFLRFLLTVLFVLLLFSPGINVVFFGLVILLGIAENWIPIRQPGKRIPPATP